MVNFKPETDEYLANTTSFFSTYTKMSKICPLSKACFFSDFLEKFKFSNSSCNNNFYLTSICLVFWKRFFSVGE